MFAKIENNKVVEWPIVSISAKFPNTSFTLPIREVDLPEGYVIVSAVAPPEHSQLETVVPAEPVYISGRWVQGWKKVPLNAEELEQRALSRKQQRAELYKTESDPLFFKWQRGEASKEDWLAKVQEIKDTFPE